jgi:hypothetical protein
MLEKIFRCALITKLQSILLMVADFNATNKTVYGIRMLANVRKYKLMPEEVYSERNSLVDVEPFPKSYSLILLVNYAIQQVWRLLMPAIATTALHTPWRL